MHAEAEQIVLTDLATGKFSRKRPREKLVLICVRGEHHMLHLANFLH